MAATTRFKAAARWLWFSQVRSRQAVEEVVPGEHVLRLALVPADLDTTAQLKALRPVEDEKEEHARVPGPVPAPSVDISSPLTGENIRSISSIEQGRQS